MSIGSVRSGYLYTISIRNFGRARILPVAPAGVGQQTLPEVGVLFVDVDLIDNTRGPAHARDQREPFGMHAGYR
ncbi:MAG: hypothetical protein IPK65_02600 [Gammaproteobacteria bacterium]|nr:hypothetical protein [Gammaproteobacteria bacterium]